MKLSSAYRPLLIALSLLAATPVAFAADDADIPVAEEKIVFETTVDTDVYPTKAFQKKGQRVRAMPKKKSRTALPEAAERDAGFAKVPEVNAHLEKMPDMDKDIFFVRARTQTLDELKKSYPNISEDVLRRLQQRLR